ncbi:MAG: hypothetical protein WA177_12835, partial [Xanthobacteraceae bacterium]
MSEAIDESDAATIDKSKARNAKAHKQTGRLQEPAGRIQRGAAPSKATLGRRFTGRSASSASGNRCPRSTPYA